MSLIYWTRTRACRWHENWAKLTQARRCSTITRPPGVADLAETVAGLERNRWPISPKQGTTEVARRLGIHRVNAATLVRRGRLPAIKVANRWLVRRGDLERFARTHVKGPGRRKVKSEEGG